MSSYMFLSVNFESYLNYNINLHQKYILEYTDVV